MACLSQCCADVPSLVSGICLIALSISLSGVNSETTEAHSHAECTDSSHSHGHTNNSNGKNDSHDAHAHSPTMTTVTPTPEPTLSPEEIKQKLEDLAIVPDIIPEAPKEKLDVWYGLETAEFGNIIHEDVVSKQPILLMWRWNSGDYFTVIATGPDVPTAELPTDAEWRHWMVINIPGNEIHKGQTLRDYEGFGNETKLGFHRMAFLVFKQSQPYMKSDEAKLRHSGSYRGFFSTRNFVRTHNLGTPVAANFIVVNCTNIIHDPEAMKAAMMTTTTTTTTKAETSPHTTPTTTIEYQWTAYAEHVTEDSSEKKSTHKPSHT